MGRIPTDTDVVGMRLWTEWLKFLILANISHNSPAEGLLLCIEQVKVVYTAKNSFYENNQNSLDSVIFRIVELYTGEN